MSIDNYRNKILCGNAMDILKEMPDESVNCVISSPPYWALRAYNSEPVIWDGDENCEHKWGNKIIRRDRGAAKGTNAKVGNQIREVSGVETKQGQFCSKCGAWRGELGLEPTFDLYLKHLCDIYDEVFRVLRKDGTCWVNLGDTYNPHTVSKEWADKAPNKKLADGVWRSGGRDSQYKAAACRNSNIGLPDKCLCLIPQRFAIEMVNRGWILRNVINWVKSNPMPSSARDRFTVDFEYVFFFVKQKRYFFEPQYEPYQQSSFERMKYPVSNEGSKNKTGNYAVGPNAKYNENPLGRNKRTTWIIPTSPCPEAHFATFPPKLVEPMILAGCPKEVCKKCGQGRKKIYDLSKVNVRSHKLHKGRAREAADGNHPEYQISGFARTGEQFEWNRREIGLTKCQCNAGFCPGIVLDMFGGTGTVGEMAAQLGRDYILIDIQPDYVKNMAEPRLKAVEIGVPVAEQRQGQKGLFE